MGIYFMVESHNLTMSVPCEQIPKFLSAYCTAIQSNASWNTITMFFDVSQQTISVSKAVFIHNTVGYNKDVEISQASLGRLVKENDLCPVFFRSTRHFFKTRKMYPSTTSIFNYLFFPSLLSWYYLQCVSHDKKGHSLEEVDKEVLQSKSKTPLCITLFLNYFLFCFVLCCCYRCCCCCSNKFAQKLAM